MTKLNPVGSNQTELERPDGTTVLYSYQTPVAVFVPGKGALCYIPHTYQSRSVRRLFVSLPNVQPLD